MSAFAKTLLPSLLMFSLSGLFAFPTNALAANIIEGFTRVPTFTPPAGCVPTERAYGVLSRCEKTIEPGHSFSASVDTSAGWFVGQEDFVREQVADIKSYWTKDYPGKNLAFSSRASDVVPGNASTRDITCMEYSVTEITEATGSQSAETMMRIEGLTCAWDVEHAAEGKPTVELFWLEAAEAYLPSIGQKPMDSFDSIARELFASARLLLPRAYLVPSDAAKSAMLDWTESEANACLGPPRGSDQVAGLTRYLYSRDGCQIQLIFRNGKVYSAEGYGSEQECWWVADACDRGRSFQEAPPPHMAALDDRRGGRMLRRSDAGPRGLQAPVHAHGARRLQHETRSRREGAPFHRRLERGGQRGVPAPVTQVRGNSALEILIGPLRQ
jgi:hypothetical protein